MSSVIEACELRKDFTVRVRRGRFRRETRNVAAVDGIDLRVEAGEMLGYIGPNGAGKSTTLKMFTGVLYPSGARHQDPRQHLDRGALAGAVRAEVADQAAGLDRQADAAHRLDDAPFAPEASAPDDELLREAVDLDHPPALR